MKLFHRLTILMFAYNMARNTKQEFIEEAQQVHDERFDYSEVDYVNTHTPVNIRCNTKKKKRKEVSLIISQKKQKIGIL